MLVRWSFRAAAFAAATFLLLASPFEPRAAGQNPKTEPLKAPPASESSTAPAPPVASELTAADLEAFFGGYFPAMLEREDIAGAVVMVVKDGKVLFSHGYGYSDAEKQKPVSVDDTLFRPGSVSKLFTCTAVMQLVEQGKLDLDRDVNSYLDFKIPATYSDPVTLRRMMTHTAGFEEWDKELFVSQASQLEPLPLLLPEHLPARIFAPGTMPAYSNYAMTLAGYIVQRVSGEKFEDYITNHILRPLAMTHSTFAQPLPAELQPLMSKGYARGSGTAKDFEFVNGPPAGSMTTSAGDIARFMIAHLQDGHYGEIQILKPETARLMHTRAFGPVPELNGMALPFFQENQNGHRIVGHGGDTQYFHSHLSLILDSNVGFFISLNSAGRGETNVRGLLWNKFLDRYFPGAPPLPPAISTAFADSNTVSGSYLTSRRGETTMTKALAIEGAVTFSRDPDGTISSPQLAGVNGQHRRWREIAPMLYRDVDGQGKIAFRRNATGNFEIFSDSAAAGFQRVSYFASGFWERFLITFALIVLGGALLLWPVSWFVRRHFQRPLALGGGECRLRAVVRLVCLLDVIVFLSWLQVLTYFGSDITRANRQHDYWLYILQLLGWMCVLGAIPAAIYAFGAWKSSARWRWNRFLDPVVALGCIAFARWLWMCNLLKFGSRY